MFSKRLVEIASLIPSRSNVIDIGCDHALLDIYLTINSGCKCIAADISPSCLDKAKENIKKFKLDNEIEIVNTDGLKNIKYSKNDYIVLAGMGTDTILNILEDCKANNIIVQTNTDLFDFREAITEEFEIVDERVVFERNIYYVIMKLKRGYKRYSYTDYLIGPVIKNKNIGVYKAYKEYLLNKYQEIYQNIPKDKLNKRLEIMGYIRKLKRYIK